MSPSDDEYLKQGRWTNLDLDRQSRCGIPEVILAEGKTLEQMEEALLGILKGCGRALISRLEPEQAASLQNGLADEVDWQYDHQARFGVATTPDPQMKVIGGKVGILTAGTSDYPVAREAQLAAEAMGCETLLELDCGAAGLHRLKEPLNSMMEWGAQVLIVAAGREGTLPTLVAGLVDRPVIGLPVSTGYGMGGEGTAALYSMLQSCAPLLVVNIDAGLVAGATAARIVTVTAEEPHG